MAGLSSESKVLTRLREAVVGADYRLYPNIRWLSKPDVHSPARDGETDLLIVHPERGLLVVETKGGRIRPSCARCCATLEFVLTAEPLADARSGGRHAAGGAEP
jgi:hypothetical protein